MRRLQFKRFHSRRLEVWRSVFPRVYDLSTFSRRFFVVKMRRVERTTVLNQKDPNECFDHQKITNE